MFVWLCFFFLDSPATTAIYTLSLHDALPISSAGGPSPHRTASPWSPARLRSLDRSEEHTSELQSQFHLVCRLLLEKKKNKHTTRVLPDDLPVATPTYVPSTSRSSQRTISLDP